MTPRRSRELDARACFVEAVVALAGDQSTANVVRYLRASEAPEQARRTASIPTRNVA
jgi:hypothetical protein